MSDLDDFFAKKDQKKKKAAARSAQAAIARAARPSNEDPDAIASPPAQKQSDDGWIEIEDVRGSQVQTGGRTIVQFRRNVEVKDIKPDGKKAVEKFSGWAKTDQNESAEPPTTAARAPINSFPTLADAAKVKKVPQARTESSAVSSSRRPRFTVANKEKLRLALTGDRTPNKPPKN